VLTGLDVCVAEGFARFRGQRIALVCNQASVDGSLQHALDLFLAAQAQGVLKVACALGPQHGIWGHTQDNMVEWAGYLDARTGVRFHSLYGEHREPTDGMLAECDRVVFDVQDVGARYYTFVWSLANCMKACERLGLPLTVLDRPNPIAGVVVEGPVLEPGFESFVGLHPLPIRHGMTIGEAAVSFRSRFSPGCDLSVVELSSWESGAFFEATGREWVLPSPNMPSVGTAVVYPGQCLLEGTNLSEGRGTTRPFEVFGAPWVDAWRLTERLDRFKLPGVRFRPYVFQPTFQKHAGQVCGGAFLHVLDRGLYRPVLTTVAVLQALVGLWPERFSWSQPPYEYEKVRLPIDILAGNAWLRTAVEEGRPLSQVEERMEAECAAFEPHRQASLIYPRPNKSVGKS
jgi:uncharacterized protein YbbC (DUF1343 family)